MKRFNFLLTALIAFFLVFGLMQAPLFALADDDSSTVSTIEVPGGVIYYGTISFSTADSTNNIYTQAMEKTWLIPKVLQVYGNAASGIDVNLFLAGSNHLDLTYFAAGFTDPNLDALGSATPKMVALDQYYGFITGLAADLPNVTRSALGAGDTTGSNWAVPYDDPAMKGRYIVLKADGQTGNPSTATITFYLYCEYKPEYYEALKQNRALKGYQVKNTT